MGHGDIVPTTPAPHIFSVFVVLLGYGELSIVTAAMWVETQGQRVEREILADLHREMKAMRANMAALRRIIESQAQQPGNERSQRKPP